jgi:hypothetical protein
MSCYEIPEHTKGNDFVSFVLDTDLVVHNTYERESITYQQRSQIFCQDPQLSPLYHMSMKVQNLVNLGKQLWM